MTQPPLRIGILCHASFGGSARIATELAIELAQQCHTVHLFAQATPFGHWDHTNGVRLHCLTAVPAPFDARAGLYINWKGHEFEAMIDLILNVIKSEGLDIIHFHYAIPFAYVAAEIKRRLGECSPIIIGTLHGTDVSFHAEHGWRGLLLKDVLRQMDGLTTVSHSHARLATRNLDLPQEPLVIHNFVDLARFYPNQRHKQRNRPVIVHVSNFRPVKRTRLLALLYARIASHLDAELWLVGDGPDLRSVKDILTANGCDRDVNYWGLRKNTAPILQQANLLMMTSITESFCLVAMEAMASGVPVLSTNVGGVPEIVLHGKTGLLFDPHDLDGASHQAVRLLSDPSRIRKMSQAAALHATCFGRADIGRQYVALYHKLINQPQPLYLLDKYTI